MYTGSNPSALRSQKWIAEALLELMGQKDWNSITIMELCRKADLTRQTFYQFFKTREDVLRYLLRQYYGEFEARLLQYPRLDLGTIVEEFFDFFRDRRDTVELLIDNHLAYLMAEEFSHALPKFLEVAGDRFQIPALNHHMLAFIAGGLSAMLLSWVKSGTPDDEAELKQQFTHLFGAVYPNDAAL